jgi:DNA-binding NarL/FixJ family response regulator
MGKVIESGIKRKSEFRKPARPVGGKAPLSVFILYDHPMVRYGIASLLATRSDLRLAGQTHSGPGILEILDRARPDLLLMDVELEEGGATALLQKISGSNLHTRTLVYSAHAHESHVLEAMRCGAHGYLTSNASPEQLCEAMLVVARGEFYIDPAIASKVVARVGRKHERRTRLNRELTQRETAVLHRLAAGMRNSEIACDLHITERTVKYHITSMFNKLRARNRIQVVQMALQNGLIKQPIPPTVGV